MEDGEAGAREEGGLEGLGLGGQWLEGRDQASEEAGGADGEEEEEGRIRDVHTVAQGGRRVPSYRGR